MSAEAAIGDRYTVIKGVPRPGEKPQSVEPRRITKRQRKVPKSMLFASAVTGLVKKK